MTLKPSHRHRIAKAIGLHPDRIAIGTDGEVYIDDRKVQPGTTEADAIAHITRKGRPP